MFGWKSPFLVENFPVDLCYPQYGNATSYWVYNTTKKKTTKKIVSRLIEKARNRAEMFIEQLENVEKLKEQYYLTRLDNDL